MAVCSAFCRTARSTAAVSSSIRLSVRLEVVGRSQLQAVDRFADTPGWVSDQYDVSTARAARHLARKRALGEVMMQAAGRLQIVAAGANAESGGTQSITQSIAQSNGYAWRCRLADRWSAERLSLAVMVPNHRLPNPRGNVRLRSVVRSDGGPVSRSPRLKLSRYVPLVPGPDRDSIDSRNWPTVMASNRLSFASPIVVQRRGAGLFRQFDAVRIDQHRPVAA